MPGEHARFSPSGFKTIALCRGKLLAEEALPPRPGNIHSATGTVKHTVSERVLKRDLEDPYTQVGTTHESDGFKVTLTEEDIDHVMVYVGYVRELLAEHQPHGGYLLIEQRVYMHGVHKDCWGTADAIIIVPGLELIVVIDAKFGRIYYSETDWQGRLYGIGALYENGEGAYNVETHICQPRTVEAPFRFHRYTAQELREEEAEANIIAIEALNPNAPRTPSIEACRYCAAFGTCREAKALVADDVLYNLADSLNKIPMLTAWIEAVHELSSTVRKAGLKIPGYKEVLGRAGNRAWDSSISDDDLTQWLAGVGVKEPRKPAPFISPAEAERAIKRRKKGKDEALAELATHVVQSPPGRTLVPESDPREEATTATSGLSERLKSIGIR